MTTQLKMRWSKVSESECASAQSHADAAYDRYINSGRLSHMQTWMRLQEHASQLRNYWFDTKDK